MIILFWGLTLFIIAFTLHLIIWKIRLPKKQTNTLLAIFFSTLVIGICALTALNISSLGNSRIIPLAFSEYLHICLLFISLTLAYIITYSAIEVDSPSLVMVLAIDKAGKNGLDKKELEKNLTDNFLIVPRVNDLLRDKLIYEDNNKFKLTSKGKSFVSIFIFWRKLIKAQIGG